MEGQTDSTRSIREYAVSVRKVSSRSLALNLVIAIVKIAGAMLSGSVAVLSEALHATADVVSSMFVFLATRWGSNPPDDDHPYGHGKAESLSGFGEGILLLVVDGYIVVEAIHHLVAGHRPGSPIFGVVAMLIASVLSFGLRVYVGERGTAVRSPALTANARHLLMDGVTGAAVACALLLEIRFPATRADSFAALALSAWIARGAFLMVRDALRQLLDRALDETDLDSVRKIVRDEPEAISFHKLRSRRSGATKYVELHVVVPNDWSVTQSHELADQLEKKVQAALAPAVAVIHVDPYDEKKDRSKFASQ